MFFFLFLPLVEQILKIFGFSADCDRFGFVTCFQASFDAKRCQFAFLMLNFVIIVWGSEFLLWMLTDITQWSPLEGLSVTFQVSMACEEEDTIVVSIVDFEVPVVLECSPSLKNFSWFLLIKFKT